MLWLQCCWWSFTAKVVWIYLDWIGKTRAAFGWTWLDIGPFNSIRQIWCTGRKQIWLSGCLGWFLVQSLGWAEGSVLLFWCRDAFQATEIAGTFQYSGRGEFPSFRARLAAGIKTNTMEVERADRFQYSELFDPFKSKLRSWDIHFPAHFTAFWISSTQSSDDISCDSRKNVILLKSAGSGT